MTQPFCPHCGYNFEADAPVVSGRWRVTPYSVELDGRAIHLPLAEAGTLYAIASARGEVVRKEAIANRISDSEDPGNIVDVYLTRLRKKLPGVPIQTVWGLGCRWAA